MDSAGNSGSMQSSSGGDDQEFDSRGDSISSFLNASHHFSSISAAPHPQPPFLSHQNPNFFVDPHQNLDHGGAHYANDNDLIWSRGLRSDHSFSNLGNSSLPTSRPHHPNIPNASFPGPSSSADAHASRAPPLQQQQTTAVKNPKKRTRASRRAPTTVLTTDTTNFRQMVQEFTGIPAAPFSGSPYSRRLDLFSAASALRSASHLDSLGPLFPHRPAAQKFGLSPFSSSTPPSLLNPTMIDATVPTTTITNNANNNNLGASTSNNPNSFQLSGDHHHNHLLSIHQHGIPQPPSLQLGANAPMNFANLSSFLSRDGASASAVQVRGNDDDLSRWKRGETVRNNDGVEENLVEFDGNNINSGESQNYNLNVAEKGMENVASSSAAEGTVASWICSSD